MEVINMIVTQNNVVIRNEEGKVIAEGTSVWDAVSNYMRSHNIIPLLAEKYARFNSEGIDMYGEPVLNTTSEYIIPGDYVKEFVELVSAVCEAADVELMEAIADEVGEFAYLEIDENYTYDETIAVTHDKLKGLGICVRNFNPEFENLMRGLIW
jgi:hypothetical protein